MYNEKNNLIVVNYNGVIHEHSNTLLENSIIYQEQRNKENKVNGILISLKNVYYEGDSLSIKSIIKILDKLSQKLKVIIGFIDYSTELYVVLKQLTKNYNLKLFKNSNAANLFLDPKSFKEDLCILVYDEDTKNSKELSKELSKYGYTVLIAKSQRDFEALINKNEHDIVITNSSLNLHSGKSASSTNTLTLSKELIKNLPVFMDTAAQTLISFTGLEAKKSSHTIKSFDTHLNTDIICAVMPFNGNLEGYFTLIFPRDIAIITMETLLGETVDENDTESLKDGVGEFCNIITGSVKTVFTKKDIKIIFDLPKTYTSLEETNGYIGKNNGIWIDMQLEGKPFYMFITK